MREGRKEERKEEGGIFGYTLVLNKASYDTVVSFARFSPMIYDRIHKSSHHHLPRLLAFLFTIWYYIIKTKIEKTGYDKSLQMSLRHI